MLMLMRPAAAGVGWLGVAGQQWLEPSQGAGVASVCTLGTNAAASKLNGGERGVCGSCGRVGEGAASSVCVRAPQLGVTVRARRVRPSRVDASW